MTIPTNPPANPIPGAVYIDLATNFAYVWTGNNWVRATGGSTSYNTQITTGATILPGFFASPNPKDFVPQIGVNEPTSPYAGQLWTDTSQTPSPTYIWDGLQWVVIADGAVTNTFVNSVPPTNPDVGDTFYETTTNRFYVWDGTTWGVVGGLGDTHSYTGTGNPSLSLRPDGTALIAGDQYVDTTGPSLYVWTGTGWVPITGSTVIVDTDTHSFTGAGSPTLTLRPDGTSLLVGDNYTDTTNDLNYYWDGAVWTEYQCPETHASLATSTIDVQSADYFTRTLTASSTFVFTNAKGAPFVNSFILRLVSNGNAVTWPTSVDWEGGVLPTLTATAGAKDILGFFSTDGGTTWEGIVLSLDSK